MVKQAADKTGNGKKDKEEAKIPKIRALYLEEMKVNSVGGNLDLSGLFEVEPKRLAKTRQTWVDNFAAVVSPWLTNIARDASGNVAATAARRDLDAVLAGTQQLLLGLAHMGERGLAHLDVKPANTMLNDGVWTLIDLGFACVNKRKQFDVQPSPGISLFSSKTQADCHTLLGINCNPQNNPGTPRYASPSLFAGGQVFDGIYNKDPPSDVTPLCVFNRHACKDSNGLADIFVGYDSFAVGVTLFEFLIGNEVISIFRRARFTSKLELGTIDNSQSEFAFRTFYSARIARFLALDDVTGTHPFSIDDAANNENLRVKVRARMRALLEVALAAAADESSGEESVFGNQPPATAAGIVVNAEQNLCVSSSESSLFIIGSKRQYKSAHELVATSPMKICTWNPQKKACECGQAAESDAGLPAGWGSKSDGSGTDALLELLANLLSPSKTPGLAKEKTTLLALADSVDAVRIALYDQWVQQDKSLKEAKTELSGHLKAVAECIQKKKCNQSKSGSATCTVAEASAYCRWLSNKNSGVVGRSKSLTNKDFGNSDLLRDSAVKLKRRSNTLVGQT